MRAEGDDSLEDDGPELGSADKAIWNTTMEALSKREESELHEALRAGEAGRGAETEGAEEGILSEDAEAE